MLEIKEKICKFHSTIVGQYAHLVGVVDLQQMKSVCLTAFWL